MTLKLDPAELKNIIERYRASEQQAKPVQPPVQPQIPIANVARPENYVVIPNTNILIAKTQSHNNLQWQETKDALAKDNKFMPWPSLFMQYYAAVISASQGKTTLYDGAGRIIDSTEIQQLYTYLTGKASDTPWVWLDAKFEAGNGVNGLDIIISELNAQGIINNIRQPLQPCLLEDCFADLDSLNAHGLLTKKSKQQKYLPANNIYFWYPRVNAVARFDAVAGRSFLDCDRYPRDAGSSLGVFECAPQAPRKVT